LFVQNIKSGIAFCWALEICEFKNDITNYAVDKNNNRENFIIKLLNNLWSMSY